MLIYMNKYADLHVAPSSTTSAICPNVTNGKQNVMIADPKTQQRRQDHYVTMDRPIKIKSL